MCWWKVRLVTWLGLIAGAVIVTLVWYSRHEVSSSKLILQGASVLHGCFVMYDGSY